MCMLCIVSVPPRLDIENRDMPCNAGACARFRLDRIPQDRIRNHQQELDNLLTISSASRRRRYTRDRELRALLHRWKSYRPGTRRTQMHHPVNNGLVNTMHTYQRHTLCPPDRFHMRMPRFERSQTGSLGNRYSLSVLHLNADLADIQYT